MSDQYEIGSQSQQSYGNTVSSKSKSQRPASAQLQKTQTQQSQEYNLKTQQSNQQPEIEQVKQNARPQSAKVFYQSFYSYFIKGKTPKLIGKGVDKDKTHEFFKETKVGACAHVVIQGGVPKAVPFYAKPKKSYAEQMQKMGQNQSHSQQQFKVHPNVTLGSPKKPLVPYHPDSQRNRLSQPMFKPPQNNASQIQFGDGSKNTRQFVSSAKANYGNHANFGFTSNPAILGHRAQKHKEGQNK